MKLHIHVGWWWRGQPVRGTTLFLRYLKVDRPMRNQRRPWLLPTRQLLIKARRVPRPRASSVLR